MTSFYQLNITGQEDFRPPKVNFRQFLDRMQQIKPELLAPHKHGELIQELAHSVGFHPERWSKNPAPIIWLLKVSPDLERACRAYRADAY